MVLLLKCVFIMKNQPFQVRLLANEMCYCCVKNIYKKIEQFQFIDIIDNFYTSILFLEKIHLFKTSKKNRQNLPKDITLKKVYIII